MIKNIIISLLIILTLSNVSYSAAKKGGIVDNYKAINNINNKASLQRGAKYFMNYCSGCHSLKYMRMSTLAEDLDIEETVFAKNLIFADKKNW